ncbi:MAG: alkaline phosphatase family protein [Candidatus Bathyarchaeota archaeon]|nr:alkaline phosphatase family protein [Candidatus Bathyarchaeota archaeon]
MRVLVLGFDGASPKLINNWIHDLPFFRKFKKEGIFGQTTPPIPAQTPVAWSTFMTGKNPGNHGIFSFALRKKGTYERNIIGPEMLKSKTIWRILSESGKRVGIINVPMSDIEKINGFIIPGFLSKQEGIPYPESIKEEIERKFKINRIRGDLESQTLIKVETEPDLFFDEINRITDEMTEIALYMIEKEKWDFFMPVFMGLDRIQHFFWRNIDKNHPKYIENKFSKFVKDFYIKVDRIARDFYEFIDENTIVMLLSDHGFCPIFTEVIINNYLEERGFLTEKFNKIDLGRSRAVSYGYGDIWLNVKGREPMGILDSDEEYDKIRDQIIDYFKKITINGEKPIKDVKKREDLWRGKHINEAPDLSIIFNIGYQAARNPLISDRNELGLYINDNPRWSGGHDGTHDPRDVPGFIGMLGPGIPAGKNVKIDLQDIAPTILSLMNISIPGDMDGKSLKLART